LFIWYLPSPGVQITPRSPATGLEALHDESRTRAIELWRHSTVNNEWLRELRIETDCANYNTVLEDVPTTTCN